MYVLLRVSLTCTVSTHACPGFLALADQNTIQDRTHSPSPFPQPQLISRPQLKLTSAPLLPPTLANSILIKHAISITSTSAHVYVYLRICMHVCMCACVHVCMCACVHVYMYVCVCLHNHVWSCMHAQAPGGNLERTPAQHVFCF